MAAPDSVLPQSAAALTEISGDTALLLDIKPVLAHNYAGIDTAALLTRIQERQKWGEKDERLSEAEGILHWDRGDITLAMPCFKSLSHPGALAMGLMAEGLLSKGDRYEAATWFLNSARASRQNDPFAIAMFKRYLEIKPGDTQVELQLAVCLEQQFHYAEAEDIYWRHADILAKNPQAALRVGALLFTQGKAKEAESLYRQARSQHPEEKGLSVRLAEVHESMGLKLEAAQAWTDAWLLDPADSAARNRAIAHLEGAGSAGESALQSLLEKATAAAPASGSIHFKYAVLLLGRNDRKGAYVHLEKALQASPGNPTYQARLSDAIESDSLIIKHFPVLKEKYEKEGASMRLALQVARGFSLTGDKPNACLAWSQLSALAPKQLEGRRDAFLDLTACGDPASLMLASIIGDKYLSNGFDREAARAMVQIAMRLRNFPKASGYAKRMVMEAPEDAPMALTAAKAMLDAGRGEEAKDVLAVIAQHATNPEASMLLGRLHYAAKDYPHAAEQFLIARQAFPEAMRLRGDCLVELKDYEGAAAEYESHFAQSGDKESLRAVAHMYRELHYGAKEEEVLETLAAKGWAGEEEKMRLAALAAGQGQNRKAMDIYDELLSSRSVLPPGDSWTEAAILLGTQQARDGKLDKAIHVLELGLKSPPASMSRQVLAEAWNRLGECLVEKHQLKEALTAYSAALSADSLSGEAAGELLEVAKKLEAKKEMGEAYRAIYRSDAAHDEANAYLGAVSQSARDYKEAAMHYRRVAQYHPKDAAAWENLGNALAMIPDLAAASAPLQTAIDLGAQSDEVYINRARAYRLEGSKDMAASILEFLLNRNPRDYLAVLWSAKFAEEDGNQQLALDFFKKTARLTAPRSLWPELLSQGMREAKVTASRDE
ncbi:MAG: tetratricopeptide repeat protein [Fibrobacteria bacterium]